MLKNTLQLIGLAGILLFVAATATAAPTAAELETARDKSLSYLIQQQNGDGSWGNTQSEKVRVTATVIDTFRKYNITGLVYNRGINWLANGEATSTDSLARQIFTLSTQGVPVNTNLILNQGVNTNDGTLWGPLTEHRYTTVDTSLVLQALTIASPENNVDNALTYLKNRRNTNAVTDPNGSGWSFSNSRHNTKDTSKVLPTSQMLLFLHHLGSSHWGTSADRNAAHWLALQQQTGGAITDNDVLADVETAMAVQALGVAKDVSGAAAAVLPAYEAGLDYLIDRQTTDGDIDSNIYKTALAAQALFNQTQVLLDTDDDGVPDSIEILIGTDPDVPDSDYLEPGNGNNYTDTSGSSSISEIIISQTVVLQIDPIPGDLLQLSGTLPPGMTINGINKTIIGTPSTIGNYSFSYRITKDDGAIHFGTISIRVVDPDSDTDNDGMPASYEANFSDILSSLNSNDAAMDSDGDGLTNFMEYSFGTNPTLTDTDGDGSNDGDESSYWGENWNVDYDGDGLINLFDIDSDNDGVPDGAEIIHGSDPADANSQPSLSVVFEIGEVDIDNTWSRVEYDSPFSQPVVVARVITTNEMAPCVVRIKNVDTEGFDIRLQEYDYLDDIHAVETVSYMVMERGSYTLDSGVRVEADTFVNSGTSFSAHDFSVAFTQEPILLSSINSFNEEDAITDRIQNISTTSFEYKMQEQQSNSEGHAEEVIAYIAWEPSYGTVDGMSFDVGKTADKVRNRWFSVSYRHNYQNPPIIIPGMLSQDGLDTAALRCVNILTSGFQVMVQEEQSADDETRHTSETVGYIAVGHAAFRLEIGEVDINHTWSRINYDSSFSQPVVVARVISVNDMSPCIVRIKDVDNDGFDIRLQEYDYQDDIHAVETVSYMVMERGSYTLDSGVRVEADTFVNSGTSFSAHDFSVAFTQEPILLSSINSFNEEDAITDRIQNISTTSFEYKMQEQQSSSDGHTEEMVSYIAWEPSSEIINGLSFEVARTPDKVRNRWYSVLYGNNYQNSPILIPGLQSQDGLDTAAVRCQNILTSGFQVMVQEEQSADDETRHTSETVGYIAVEQLSIP